jgi:hypothetical protein
MFLSSQKTENNIIRILRKGAVPGAILLTQVSTLKKVSKENFYRILRKLLKEEVIIKNKTQYAINSRWLDTVSDFINSGQGQIINLQQGDQITYNFSNARSMYDYWAYVYDFLFEQHDRKVPILLYHSYQWFIYAREDSEKIFLNKFTKNKQLGMLCIGNNSQSQKDFKRTWSSKYLQINTGITYSNDHTVYINVVGDYIFKVYTSKKFALQLESFFKKYPVITDEARLEIIKLSQEKDRTKLVIKRSLKESQKWFSRYRKDFVGIY